VTEGGRKQQCRKEEATEGMEKEQRVDPLKVQKLKVRLESPAVKAAEVIQSQTKPIRLTRNQT